jgi:hypothetical protein
VPWVSYWLSGNWKFTLGVLHYTAQRFYELLPQMGDSEPPPPSVGAEFPSELVDKVLQVEYFGVSTGEEKSFWGLSSREGLGRGIFVYTLLFLNAVQYLCQEQPNPQRW